MRVSRTSQKKRESTNIRTQVFPRERKKQCPYHDRWHVIRSYCIHFEILNRFNETLHLTGSKLRKWWYQWQLISAIEIRHFRWCYLTGSEPLGSLYHQAQPNGVYWLPVKCSLATFKCCDLFQASIATMETDSGCQPRLGLYSISFRISLRPSGYDMRSVDEHRLPGRHEIVSKSIRQDTRYGLELGLGCQRSLINRTVDSVELDTIEFIDWRVSLVFMNRWLVFLGKPVNSDRCYQWSITLRTRLQ